LPGGPTAALFAVMGFTVVAGKIVAIDVLTDPERLNRLDLSALGPASPQSG